MNLYLYLFFIPYCSKHQLLTLCSSINGMLHNSHISFSHQKIFPLTSFTHYPQCYLTPIMFNSPFYYLIFTLSVVPQISRHLPLTLAFKEWHIAFNRTPAPEGRAGSQGEGSVAWGCKQAGGCSGGGAGGQGWRSTVGANKPRWAIKIIKRRFVRDWWPICEGERWHCLKIKATQTQCRWKHLTSNDVF